jgi:glycosyltransferase involved in cell wall biosynthesis
MLGAWRARPAVRDVDALVTSSHAVVRAIRVAPGIPHVCYCHTPMRYAWDFESERARFPGPVATAARPAMALLRRIDRETAQGVTRFIANSRAVAERIRRFYGRDACVVHPPVRTEYFTPGSATRGETFLYVGRLVSYKRPDLVVEAFGELPHRLLVVGDGHLGPALRERATPNVEFIESVTDEELRNLYRTARALVYPGEEDFGIVMAEAQACGTPVIALGRGGATDIVQPGVTGWLIERQDVAALQSAVRTAARTDLEPTAIRAGAERFSADRFRAAIRSAVAETIEEGRLR